MKKLATTSWSVRAALAAREPFNTHGAFRAITGATTGYASTGRLPEPYATQYRDAADAGRITYTVMSHDTPIAWVLDDNTVVIPNAKYSITTTGHQGLLYALKQPADGPLAEAAERERQSEREAARQRRGEARERAATADLAERTGLTPLYGGADTDWAPVRMEYSESYSVRQGWATSTVKQLASGVNQEA